MITDEMAHNSKSKKDKMGLFLMCITTGIHYVNKNSLVAIKTIYWGIRSM